MWKLGRNDLYLTGPNSFGIQIISSYISITVELQRMASYMKFREYLIHHRSQGISQIFLSIEYSQINIARKPFKYRFFLTKFFFPFLILTA